MLDKWNELRPDLHMSITALGTKGKRIFDRATNNPAPRNPWLTRSDLHEVEKKVLNDIRCVHPLNNEYEPEVPSGCTQPPSMNDDGHNSDLDPDYVCLLNRCVEIFDILKSQGILEQPRRPLRKKNLSYKRLDWANSISKHLSSMVDPEDCSLDIVNTISYCIASVFTNKEGEELQSPLQTGESTATKDKRCPPPPMETKTRTSCC